jgi:hypothetical protein
MTLKNAFFRNLLMPESAKNDILSGQGAAQAPQDVIDKGGFEPPGESHPGENRLGLGNVIHPVDEDAAGIRPDPFRQSLRIHGKDRADEGIGGDAFFA